MKEKRRGFVLKNGNKCHGLCVIMIATHGKEREGVVQDWTQARLLRRARQGDADAFEQLVAPYEKRIYALCLRMLAHREDAQDAAQEALLRLYRAMGSYRGDAQLGTFIYRVTANTCMDALRRRRVRAGESLEALYEEGFSPEDSAPGPEELALHDEKRRVLAEAMQALPEEQREILILRVVNDLPYERIAEILDLQLGTVKSRLARARMQLKKILADGNHSNLFSSK